MKKIATLFALFISGLLNAQSPHGLDTIIRGNGTILEDSIISGGNPRNFLIYVPNMYTGATNVPLLLNFHGFGSDRYRQIALGDFTSIADTANFIIVIPQGLGNPAAWPIQGNSTDSDGFIEFVDNLIDSVSDDYTIDEQRIYTTGMSYGGFASFELACKLSNRIAAVGNVTGSMKENRFDFCAAKHPTPVITINGTADAFFPDGGCETSQIGFVQCESIEEVTAFWVDFNKCDTTRVKTEVPDVNTSDNSTVEHFEWTGGDGGTTVEYYKVIGGGHEWPGALIESSGYGARNMDFDASKVIWEFFRKNAFLTDINNSQEKSIDATLFPNPSNGNVTISCDYCMNATIVVSDILGRQVGSFSISGNGASFDFGDFLPGAYTYQILKGQQILGSGKLMIQ
jgi:polyhydroxybutyrate depolymerase